MAKIRELNKISRMFIASTLFGVGLENAFDDSKLSIEDITYIKGYIDDFAEKVLPAGEEYCSTTDEIVDKVLGG